MNLLPNKQILIIVPIQSTRNSKKEKFNLYMDNKSQKIIGDVFCPTCKKEKCVFISTDKTSSSCDCNKCEASCHFLSIPLKKHKPTLTLFGGDGACCLAKRRSRDYRKPSPLMRNFLRHSQTTATEPEPRKNKNTPNFSIRFELPVA